MQQRNTLVLKFGGSSMANLDSITRVIEIVLDQRKTSAGVTVVSAMAGVTDKLLGLGHDALRNRSRKVDAGVAELREAHATAFTALAANDMSRRWIGRFVEEQFEDVSGILRGIMLLGEFSAATRDKLLSYGEILSSRLLARVLEDRCRLFCHSDARDWIIADRTRQGPVVDFAESESRIRDRLAPVIQGGQYPVVPGFICRDSQGAPSTLGRNGSDYSASIIGASLRAREILIYTDVDGIMTADPNLVAEARILPQISYQEAAEMSYFGAKVLHPKTMIPAVRHRIPIRIKNTFNPAASGTLIADHTIRAPQVKTVTSVRNLCLINIQGNGMAGMPGVSSRIFEVLGREDINLMMISQSSSEHSICMLIQAADAERALNALRRELRLEIERNMIDDVQLTPGVSIVSIIGAGMRGTPGTSGKFFEALGKCRVNVLAIAQGSSELNISAAIAEKDERHAVQAIHTAFGLTRELNVFIFGCGNIGRTLLKQIHDTKQALAKTAKVNLKVLGVANSTTLRFSAAGLSGAELQALASGTPLDALAGSEPRQDTAAIFDRIASAYRSDVVLVDATGAELAGTLLEGMRRGYHVVTANKKPLTTRLDEYLEMRKLCRRKGLNYQYEATFGAGLPLLSTLRDLMNTGDRIIRIQGCLSGTLGLICSRIDEGVPFSGALAEAVSLGYTEPDPRDDLSGRDVARKALIIAREIGIFLEPEEVKLNPIVPARFFKDVPRADLMQRVAAADPVLQEEVRAAAAEGKVLRYMTDIGKDCCEVGLKRVPRDSPIGRLAGPDNILVFQSQRYFDHQLVIQGPGAGAGVTAAGVLSDILKIAKWVLEYGSRFVVTHYPKQRGRPCDP